MCLGSSFERQKRIYYRKRNKIRLDQDSDQDKSFKKILEDNDIKMYSTYNEWKSVVAERFIKILKNKV